MTVPRTVTAALKCDEVFSLIVSRTPEVVQVDAATIRLLDPSGKTLELKAASGVSQTDLHRGPFDAEEGVLTAQQGTPIAIDYQKRTGLLSECRGANT